jgi:two-component system chemotaxis response regulator CheY
MSPARQGESRLPASGAARLRPGRPSRAAAAGLANGLSFHYNRNSGLVRPSRRRAPVPEKGALKRMIAKSDMPNINEKRPEGVKPDGTPYRVLIVDDSMFIAKQLGQILTSEGFDVVGTAGDGMAGIEKYKELCPNIDLVTMDITMPKMDGVTALEKILEFDKNACIVMVSALGKEDVVKKSLLLGAKSYIVKPLDRKKVLERIQAVLKR